MSGTGLPCGNTQCRKAAGTFHVPTFLVLDSGGPRGKGTAAPMLLVRNVHTNREAHQELPYGKMQMEYTDYMEETIFGDSAKFHGGSLQYNMGGQSGVF